VSEAAPRLLCLILLLGAGVPAEAQPGPITAYLQTVPLWSDTTSLTDSDLRSFNRLRLTIDQPVGPVSIGVAYEHVVTFRRGSVASGIGVGAVPSGGEALDLQWTIADEGHVRWQHRFDRLQVGWSPVAGMAFTGGRQAVSWGTTLFLTPADPFVPFNPADPFREFRAGVDAARLQMYPGPLSEIDLVVRPTDTAVGREITALGRGLTTWQSWELSGWGGTLYGDTAGAFGAAGSLGPWAVRGEAVIREQEEGAVFRGTVGLDHLSQVKRRDLYVIVEYQRDGLAASGVDQYPAVLQSNPFSRGELQVLGRDETVVQASYQLQPLWSLAGVWVWNLNDRSALISPSFAYSLSDESSISGGVFLGIGDDEVTATRLVPSEYGPAGTSAFLSLSWFF
jgi:hypothetical protein